MILVALVLAWPVLFGDTRQLVSNVSDDAYYYLNVARNATQGYGLSFDRINSTNGHHPLWMLFLFPIYRIVPDIDTALRVVLLCQVLLSFVSLELLPWGVGAVYRLFLCAALPLALYVRFTYLLTGGMESPLVFLLLITSFSLFIRVISVNHSIWSDLALGLALGFLFLARLDYVIFVGTGVLFLIAKYLPKYRLHPHSLIQTVLLATPTFLFGLLYLAWNWSGFGHFMTISGALKSSFPALQPRLGLWNMLYPEYLFIALLAAVFTGLVIARRVFPRIPFLGQLQLSRLPKVEALVWLCVSTILHYSLVSVFGKWGVDVWYFAGYIVTLIAIVAASLSIASILLPCPSRFLFAVVAFVLILSAASISHFVAIRNRAQGQVGFTPYAYDAALWVRKSLPSDAVLGMNDAGTFGYFSDRQVVNLDGIINNFEYQDYLHRRQFAAYLKDKRISYIVANAIRDRRVLDSDYDCVDFGSYSHLYEVSGGAIQVCKGQEVYRSKSFYYQSGVAQLIIWEISK
jgi:hypothetical protein